jgi:hypothetical protein
MSFCAALYCASSLCPLSRSSSRMIPATEMKRAAPLAASFIQTELPGCLFSVKCLSLNTPRHVRPCWQYCLFFPPNHDKFKGHWEPMSSADFLKFCISLGFSNAPIVPAPTAAAMPAWWRWIGSACPTSCPCAYRGTRRLSLHRPRRPKRAGHARLVARRGGAIFTGATFGDFADLTLTLFGGDFTGVALDSFARFYDATFDDHAIFTGATCGALDD